MTIQERFWDWFLHHEEEMFALDPADETEREELFGELTSQLGKVDPDLTFELGPREARREFVISAAGIRRAFPSVTLLADAVPHLDRWRVIAFRPRRPVTGIVQFRGKHVDVKDVQFSLLTNGNTTGIYLFIPGYRDDDAGFKQIGYLLLDEALGEFDVESKLGLIKMFAADACKEGDRNAISDLPALFDQVVAKLEGRSGKAS